MEKRTSTRKQTENKRNYKIMNKGKGTERGEKRKR